MASTCGSEPPFPIYEDSAATPDGSYGACFDENLSDLPPEDRPIASIETCEPQPPSTRRTSAITTTSAISSFPSEMCAEDRDFSPFMPKKYRPSLRNPTAIRAAQMASPPPFESPRSGPRQHKLSSPSRTGIPSPLSTRSQSFFSVDKPHPSPRPTTPCSQPPLTPQQKRDYPLVLLHVNLLPIEFAYSMSTMATVLPEYILKNYQLLEEKTINPTLRQRGILIPHPKDEYDLLEERLLESLELASPRILKCGHFRYPEDDDDETIDGQNGSRRHSGASTASDFSDYSESDVCEDCNQPVKAPGTGAGHGKKRWEIKIYAANGLMRSGAWAAAWREMERVDVEIEPWISEEMRRELDHQRDLEEDQMRQAEQEEEARRILEAEGEERRREAEAERLTALQQRMHAENLARMKRADRGSGSRPGTPRHQKLDIPLATLLQNYLYLLAKDRRNIAIFLLGIFVLFLSMRPGPSTQIAPFPPFQPDFHSANATQCAPMPIIYTTTMTVHESKSEHGLPEVPTAASILNQSQAPETPTLGGSQTVSSKAEEPTSASASAKREVESSDMETTSSPVASAITAEDSLEASSIGDVKSALSTVFDTISEADGDIAFLDELEIAAAPSHAAQTEDDENKVAMHTSEEL